MDGKKARSRKRSSGVTPAKPQQATSSKPATWQSNILGREEGLAALAKKLQPSSPPQSKPQAPAPLASDPAAAALSPPTPAPQRVVPPVTPAAVASATETRPAPPPNTAPATAPTIASPAPSRMQVTEAALASIVTVRQRITPEIGPGGFAALIPSGVLGVIAIVVVGGLLMVAHLVMLRAENPFGAVNSYGTTTPRAAPNRIILGP